MLAVFETGVRYQMYHAFAMFAAAWAFARWQHRVFAMAGGLFAAGIVIFSGSLYLLALTGAALARRDHAVGWPGVSGRVALSRVGRGH